jgi:hypothetical protein
VSTIRKERGEPGTDLSRALWRKSTYSGGNGSCVEIANPGHGGRRAGLQGPGRAGELIFAADESRSFTGSIKAGEHSL